MNPTGQAYGEDRWRTGGGIDAGLPSVCMPGAATAGGTVDGVKDPPKELLPVLYSIKMQASAYNISLDAIFEAAGSDARGGPAASSFLNTQLRLPAHGPDRADRPDLLAAWLRRAAAAGQLKEQVAPEASRGRTSSRTSRRCKTHSSTTRANGRPKPMYHEACSTAELTSTRAACRVGEGHQFD